MDQQLIDAIRNFTDIPGSVNPYTTAIEGLILLRSNYRKMPSHLVFKPALCIVAQGAKWTTFGNRRFDYRAGQALVVSAESPALSCVAEASPEEPYLGAVIELDPAILGETMDQMGMVPAAAARIEHGVFVQDYDGPLASCVLRAVRLLETPQAIPVLYPAIMREICYWLLSGPHGDEIVHMALVNGCTRDLTNAVHFLRDRFAEPIRIGALAAIAKLSVSSFHRQFKALTSMTPLQYQKQLRLLEARRLMMAEANAETAAFQVGYESPSQFSREYSRMFGVAPKRHSMELRSLAA
jgi:AraC-like DNA-binding protein